MVKLGETRYFHRYSYTQWPTTCLPSISNRNAPRTTASYYEELATYSLMWKQSAHAHCWTTPTNLHFKLAESWVGVLVKQNIKLEWPNESIITLLNSHIGKLLFRQLPFIFDSSTIMLLGDALGANLSLVLWWLMSKLVYTTCPHPWLSSLYITTI